MWINIVRKNWYLKFDLISNQRRVSKCQHLGTPEIIYYTRDSALI
jgi:hypothetical protein